MSETVRHIVSEEENGLQIKQVLSASLGLSRRTVTRLMTSRGILLNGENRRLTETVGTGDCLELHFPQHDTKQALFLNRKPEILYEDDCLVIVNKPYGMPAHPSREHKDDMGTLLKEYYGNDFVIRTAGRLDKDVSGIMIYAKNAETAAALAKQRDSGQLHKEYTAFAEGHFSEKTGTMTFALQKDPYHRNARAGTGKSCITDYEVIQETEKFSVLHVSIRTGRTHQIRAGMSSYGHPLLGDRLYGGNTERIPRPALHCSMVRFLQPETEKEITVECPLPEDMKKLIG